MVDLVIRVSSILRQLLLAEHHIITIKTVKKQHLEYQWGVPPSKRYTTRYPFNE